MNIRNSQASIAFLRNAADELGFDDERPDIMLREHGHLYLAGVGGAAQLRRAHTLQKACGSDVALLDRLDLGKRFGGFYVLVLLMAGTGLATAILAGLNKIVFQGSGDLPSSFTIYPTFVAHALLATILANLIVLHVLAALYHQFVGKDSLHRRMFFRRRAS